MKGQDEAFAFTLFLRLNRDPVSRQSAFTFSCIRPRIVESILRDLCNPRLSRANKSGSRPLRLYQLSSTYWKAETCIKSVPMSCIRGFNAALKRRRILRQQNRWYPRKILRYYQNRKAFYANYFSECLPSPRLERYHYKWYLKFIEYLYIDYNRWQSIDVWLKKVKKLFRKVIIQ